MLSSPKPSTPQPTVGNVEPRKVSSNQQAVPVPYFGGRAYLPLIQAQTAVYNVKPKPVVQKVGKTKQVTGFDYYGSLIGVLGLGMVDLLEAIEVAGKVVWAAPGGIERDGAHVHHSGDIVVDGVGTFRVYWGTEGQPVDDLILTPDGDIGYVQVNAQREEHPPYRGQAYIVVKDLYFGNNNATPPTIRVLVERAPRYPGLDENRTREGANPVTMIAELIANEFYGLGLPDLVHVASAAATGAAIKRETTVAVPGDPTHVASMGYIAALLDRQASAQAVFAQAMEYYDGWVRPVDGQLYFGHFPHDGVTPVGLPELTHHDFVHKQGPRFEPADDGALITEVNIEHLDRDDNMEKALTPVPNPEARRRLGFSNPRTFQRPFLCTTYQAMEQGNQLARHYSRDEEACSVTARRAKVIGLHAGDRFVLVDADSASSQVVRIVERTDPGEGGEVQLQLVLERGLAPLAYVPPPNPRPTLPDPELVPIVNARVFQLPTLFDDYGPAPAVVILAQRPGAHVAGFGVHYSNAGLSYDELANENGWALRALLPAGINGAVTTFTINASGFDIAFLAAQSDAAKDDDALLLIVDFEVMSIGNVVALGGGQYNVTVHRGRRGSSAAAHALNAVCYIVPRANLQVFQHADFPRTNVIRYFKLVTYTHKEVQELDDALQVSLNFDDTTVETPAPLTLIPKAEAIYASWKPTNDPTVIAADLWIRNAAAPAPVPGTDAPDWTGLASGHNIGGLAAGATRYVWVQYRDTIGSRSVLVGPVNATAGAAPTGPAGNPAGIDVRYSSVVVAPGTPDSNPGNWSSAADASSIWMATRTLFGGVWSAWTVSKIKGDNGVRGSKQFYRTIAGSTWSDAEANAAVAAAGLTNVLLDQVTLQNPGAGYAETRFWDGAAWLTITQVINGNLLVNGTVGASKIVTPNLAALSADLGTVTAGSITSNATINVGAVGSNRQVQISGTVFSMGGAGGMVFDGASNQYTISLGPGSTQSAILNGGTANASLQLGVGAARTYLTVGELQIGNQRVVSGRKASVSAAPEDANTGMNPGDWAGSDTISLSALNAHLNAVDARLNLLAGLINDLRDRLRVSGGHGLIDD